MARDLSEWADLAERAAHENAAYEELAAWQGAMAAVLRAVADPTAPLTSDLCSDCQRVILDPTPARVLAALTPLALLRPDTLAAP